MPAYRLVIDPEPFSGPVPPFTAIDSQTAREAARVIAQTFGEPGDSCVLHGPAGLLDLFWVPAVTA